MSTKPDFLDESSARGHALVNLAGFFVALAVLGVVVWLFPVVAKGFRLWVWIGLATVGFLLVAWAVAYGRPLLRGGTYRVAVQGGRLRVDSPHRSLGPSFDVALGEVERLVVRHDQDGPSGYEVHTRAGEAFEVNGFCAGRLFEAVRRLCPEIPTDGGGT